MMEYGHPEGEPEHLEYVEHEPVFPGSDPFLQRGREADGHFGAWLVNVCPDDEPAFLHCHELLAIAAYVERHRDWFEHHDRLNEEWWHNEVADRLVLVQLRKRTQPTDGVLIALKTKNSFAWYGIPDAGISDATRARELANQEGQEYLRAEWEEDKGASIDEGQAGGRT